MCPIEHLTIQSKTATKRRGLDAQKAARPLFLALNGNIMIQKILAHATLAIILMLFILAEFLSPGFSLGVNDFDSEIGKVLFNVVGVVIFSPIIVHTISMFIHMVVNKKYGWIVATFILAFMATLSYYFSVYKQQEENLTKA